MLVAATGFAQSATTTTVPPGRLILIPRACIVQGRRFPSTSGTFCARARARSPGREVSPRWRWRPWAVDRDQRRWLLNEPIDSQGNRPESFELEQGGVVDQRAVKPLVATSNVDARPTTGDAGPLTRRPLHMVWGARDRRPTRRAPLGTRRRTELMRPTPRRESGRYGLPCGARRSIRPTCREDRVSHPTRRKRALRPHADDVEKLAGGRPDNVNHRAKT